MQEVHMSRTIFIASIVSLIALSGIIGYWSATSSLFAGRPIGSTSVMEIPAQTVCDTKSVVDLSAPVSPKDENLPNPGICQDDWIKGWDVPTYNCDVLFGPA
jgi:hypothetical protein